MSPAPEKRPFEGESPTSLREMRLASDLYRRQRWILDASLILILSRFRATQGRMGW